VPAQDRNLPLLAGVEQTNVQFIDAAHPRQRHHAIAPDIANQAFDLALVVAFGWPTKAILEQVVTLQLAE